MGGSIGWLQPLQAGVAFSPGSRGTDTGEDMDWMDGRTGDGLGSVLVVVGLEYVGAAVQVV